MIKEKIYTFTDKIKNNESFTIKEQLGYAGGIFGNAMGQDSIGTYADKFYRNFMGLTADMRTLMDNILIVLGFFVPPIVGNILDTPVPTEKEPPSKRILKIAPIPFAITSMLLFIVPTSEPARNFIWALIFNLIFEIADQFYDMSIYTLSLRMTTNANDRGNFYTVSTLASALGSMLPGWIIPLIVGKASTASGEKWAYFFVALFFCVLGLATMYAPYFTLQEKIRVVRRPQKTRFNWDAKSVKTVLHSRSFIIIQISKLFVQIRQISYTMLPYLYEDVFDNYGMKAIIDAVSGVLSYAGLAFVPFLSKRFSAKNIMLGGYAYTGVFYLIMTALGLNFNVEKIRKIRYVIGICIGLAGMPNNAISASEKIVVGDATDYMEWYSEKNFGTPIHSEGLLISVQNILALVYKFVKTNITNAAFKQTGYKETVVVGNKKEKVVQSDSTLKGLYYLFALCGLFGNFIASSCYFFDNYSGKKKEAIMAELQQMRAARAAAAEGAEQPAISE